MADVTDWLPCFSIVVCRCRFCSTNKSSWRVSDVVKDCVRLLLTLRFLLLPPGLFACWFQSRKNTSSKTSSSSTDSTTMLKVVETVQLAVNPVRMWCETPSRRKTKSFPRWLNWHPTPSSKPFSENRNYPPPSSNQFDKTNTWRHRPTVNRPSISKNKQMYKYDTQRMKWKERFSFGDAVKFPPRPSSCCSIFDWFCLSYVCVWLFVFARRTHDRSPDDLEIIYEELVHIRALSHLSTTVKRELANIIVFESHPRAETVRKWSPLNNPAVFLLITLAGRKIIIVLLRTRLMGEIGSVGSPPPRIGFM